MAETIRQVLDGYLDELSDIEAGSTSSVTVTSMLCDCWQRHKTCRRCPPTSRSNRLTEQRGLVVLNNRYHLTSPPSPQRSTVPSWSTGTRRIIQT